MIFWTIVIATVVVAVLYFVAPSFLQKKTNKRELFTEMGTHIAGRIYIHIAEAENLTNADGWGTGESDPYAVVSIDEKVLARTYTITDNLNPEWKEDFQVDVDGNYSQITVEVWDEDSFASDNPLGKVVISVENLVNGKDKIKGWYPLEGGDKARLNFQIKYRSLQKMAEKGWGVPENEFEPRKNCYVTLFQDSHAGQGDTPPIHQESTHKFVKLLKFKKNKKDKKDKKDKKHKKDKKDKKDKKSGKHHKGNWLAEENKQFVPSNAWEQIHNSILGAEKFIYITGWSVYTHISLLRREVEDPMTLGDLLKMKAAEGVKVVLLVWDEALSMNLGFKSSTGLMCTHDEETKAFFEGTGVDCELAARKAGVTGGLMWTHHQKSVIVDAPASDVDKRVVCYVGGLDLCDGRWDTPKHSLFRTLTGEHQQDFHQACVPVDQDHGPREPWHDIHSKIEGPAAIDVKVNFEQRWMCQVGRADALFDIVSDGSFIEARKKLKWRPDDVDSDHRGPWNVQYFRSIDSTSAEGVDKVVSGIQQAYIHTIRNAKRFLYIENQYFLSSAFGWLEESDVCCNNRIAWEIASKIAHKIEKGSPFAVYALLPMYPEGDPHTGAVQEILHWQHNTVSMMYKVIADAIKKAGLEGERHPTDYLNFFCLGNRETEDGSTAVSTEPMEDPIAARVLASRRFMIYVHSKMMIADDEFIIVGSANINDRSMAGDRDTEMAIGAYEKEFDQSKEPRGHVHNFRMSLWAEHLNGSDPQFLVPENIDTVRLVRERSRDNWEAFAGDDVVEMEGGHLMKYPYVIDQDGGVTYVQEHFPDSDANVLGGRQWGVPDLLTT